MEIIGNKNYLTRIPIDLNLARENLVDSDPAIILYADNWQTDKQTIHYLIW